MIVGDNEVNDNKKDNNDDNDMMTATAIASRYN